jgi:hypothetical protein
MACDAGFPSVAGVQALVVLYRLEGATPAEHAELREQLAPAFSAFAGLRSALWLANGATGRYGIVFVFDARGGFDAFVASELFEAFRAQPSVVDATTFDFTVDRGPSEVTHGLPPALVGSPEERG